MSYDSTLTVKDGSSIDGNTAEVSLSASLSQLHSFLIRVGAGGRSIAMQEQYSTSELE